MAKATREEVYKAIDSERDYQERLWSEKNAPGHKHSHSIEEWLVYMKDYLDEAFHQVSRVGAGTPEYLKSLDTIRKVTALGVVAMEDNGAPIRSGGRI